MNNDSNWECKGYKEEPHPEIELERDESCPICGRNRNSPSFKKSKQPVGLVVAAVAVLALLGGGAGLYWWLNLNQDGPISQTLTPTPIPPPNDQREEYKWEPERFTWGQRTLFPGKGNASRNEGIQVFKQGDFSAAVKFFKRAVDAARNDPEVLILYNNALARQKGTPLRLAAVVPVEGRATSAEEMLRGLAQAQDQFNTSGGLNGRLLEIVIANDGNEPEKAERVAQELVKDESVLGVVGHNSSSASKAGLGVYEQAGLAMISPTSTSTALTGTVFFRTVPSDAAAGKKLAQYVNNKLNLSKVVIFYNPNSIYSTSLQEAFENHFTQQLGGKVVRKIDMSDRNLNAGVEVYSSVFQDRAQAALLFPDTKYTSVAIEIARANFRLPEEQRLKLLGGDALYSPTTLKAGGETVEGLVLAVPWFAESPQSQDFKKAGEKQWGGIVNWRTAMSFDATQAFIQAFSNSPSRSSVLNQLRQVKLSASETSGDEVQFSEGERQSDPILIQAVRGGRVAPQNSDFGLDIVKE